MQKRGKYSPTIYGRPKLVSKKSSPDNEKEAGSVDQEQLAKNFIEKLQETTDIPLRFMPLDDTERCPVRFIKGMLRQAGGQEAKGDSKVITIDELRARKAGTDKHGRQEE